MKRTLLTLAAFGLVSAGCSEANPAQPTAEGPIVAGMANARGPVVHHVSVGGPDVCAGIGLPTACDANFSLEANQYADGSVKGQWTDVFKIPNGTIVHATLDCLKVVGNNAWVSGVVTGPNFTGVPVITRVADNGTSSQDPVDQIGLTELDTFGGCQAAPNLLLLPLVKGQVTVR